MENQTRPSASPRLDVTKLGQQVGPAVILVSVFDASGHLLRKGTGFFISDNGRFVTSARVIESGANAIATAANGKIYNVTGLLAASSSLDLAVMKADAKHVSFLPLNKTAPPEPGAAVAVVVGPPGQKTAPLMEAAISDDRSRTRADWLELTPPLTTNNIGSPVVDGKADVVGVVTSARGPSEIPVAVRTSATQSPLLASFAPDEPGHWPGTSGATASPVSSPSPTPTQKLKLVKPSGSPQGGSALVYTPQPAYPTAARFSRPPIRGSGRFRIIFSATGEARNIEIVQSTGSPLLDNAAANALRQWRAAPGQERSVNVPITFRP